MQQRTINRNRQLGKGEPSPSPYILGCRVPSAYNYNSDAELSDGSCIYRDNDLVLVSDAVGSESHAAMVKDAVSDGYGSDISGNVIIRYGIEPWIHLYDENMHFPALVVRSRQGLYPPAMQPYYPAILFVWPLGSNNYVEITNPAALSHVVVTGAGDTQNRTAYGNALEFWDVASTSSEANGIIAGKLLKIRDERACNFWEARYAARQTASGGGSWNKFDGYGKINVAAAIAFDDEIPADPYL